MTRTTHIARWLTVLVLSLVAVHETAAQPNVVLGTEVYEGEQNGDTGYMPVYAQTYSYAEGSGAEHVQLYVEMVFHAPSGSVITSNSNQWFHYISTTTEVSLHPDTLAEGIYDAVGAVSWDYWGSMEHIGCQTNRIGFAPYIARYWFAGCGPNPTCQYLRDNCNHPCQGDFTLWAPVGNYLELIGMRIGVDYNFGSGTFSTRRCSPGWRRGRPTQGGCLFIEVS